LAHRRSLRGVSNDDMLIVKLADEADKLGDVHMPAGLGPVAVLVDVEGTFGDEDFAFCDVVELSKIDVLGVAEIRYDGQLEGGIDFDAFIFKLDDLRAGEAEVFGFELFPFFDDSVADRAPAVFGGKDLRKEVGLYSVFVAGFYADEVGGELVSVEASPGLDDVFYGRQEVFRGENRAGR